MRLERLVVRRSIANSTEEKSVYVGGIEIKGEVGKYDLTLNQKQAERVLAAVADALEEVASELAAEMRLEVVGHLAKETQHNTGATHGKETTHPGEG